jgi:hypothetical protein
MIRTFFTGLSAICMIAILGGTSMISQKRSDNNAPYRYVIVNNIVEPSLSEGDPERRLLEVLIEKNSFSKSNLVHLVTLLSKRFSSPRLMYVTIFRDLKDVQTPEERDETLASGDSSSGPIPASTTAIFVRRVDLTGRLIINRPNQKPDVLEIK